MFSSTSSSRQSGIVNISIRPSDSAFVANRSRESTPVATDVQVLPVAERKVHASHKNSERIAPSSATNRPRNRFSSLPHTGDRRRSSNHPKVNSHKSKPQLIKSNTMPESSSAADENSRKERTVSSLYVQIPTNAKDEETDFTMHKSVRLRHERERTKKISSSQYQNHSSKNSVARSDQHSSTFLSPRAKSIIYVLPSTPSPAMAEPSLSPQSQTPQLTPPLLREKEVQFGPGEQRHSYARTNSVGFCDKCLTFTCPNCLSTSSLQAPVDNGHAQQLSFAPAQVRNSRASLRSLHSRSMVDGTTYHSQLPDFRQLTHSYNSPTRRKFNHSAKSKFRSQSQSLRYFPSNSELYDEYEDDDLLDTEHPALNLLEVEHDNNDDREPILSSADLRRIHRLARRALTVSDDNSQVAASLKLSLDIYYGRVWHVVTGSGPFGSNVASLPGAIAHFKIKDCAFLVWQTPDEE